MALVIVSHMNKATGIKAILKGKLGGRPQKAGFSGGWV